MTDTDGLYFAALFQGATLLLLFTAWLSRARFRLRRPAAMLAIFTSAIGSVLLVKHAPAGAVWTPEPWSGEEPRRKAVHWQAPLRQSGLPAASDGGTGGGRAKFNDSRTETGATGTADQPMTDAAPSDGDDGRSRVGALLASLYEVPEVYKPVAGDVRRDCAQCPQMVIVPAGSAVIGAAANDALATAAEQPAQQARFWPGFAIGRLEVTVEQYMQFATATGRPAPVCHAAGTSGVEGAGRGYADRMPVTCVTWSDAASYAAWLRRVSGQPFRLPTAAEWEHAARAGNSDPGGPTSASHDNPWGVLGLGGSVAELVSDCWSEAITLAPPQPDVVCRQHMIKDGAWNEPERWRRPSARRPAEPATALPTLGFRVARDLR